MAKAKTPAVISNADLPQEDLDEVKELIAEIGRHEERIAAIHAEKLVARKKIMSKGVPAAALNASLARYRMDPEQRAEFDRGRDQVDKALGIPAHAVQGDFFDDDLAPEGGPKPEGDNVTRLH